MKKVSLVNLIVVFFCFLNSLSCILFFESTLALIALFQNVIIIILGVITLFLNSKYDSENDEYLQYFNIIFSVRLILYISIIIIGMINIFLFSEKFSILDFILLYGIPFFSEYGVDSETITPLIELYGNLFVMQPRIGNCFLAGRYALFGGQTFLILQIMYDIYFRTSIQKLKNTNIFYDKKK